jgi:K+-transporting ATPase ATPase C chain
MKGIIMFKEIRPAVVSFLLLTLLTGIAYPLLVTGLSQALMPGKANGSLIMKDGKAVGSSLIGQSFSDPKYFWSRPSATSPMPNNPTASSGSNLGPTNPALLDAVKGRVQALRDADPGNQQPVPVDLVTASASGLDPHISPAAAEYQLARVARVRNINPETVRKLLAEHTDGRQFGILGEVRVNVLELNLALDTAH